MANTLPHPIIGPNRQEAPVDSTEHEAEGKRQRVGEQLYPLVEQSLVCSGQAGKVTGMLLDMPASELARLLEAPEALEAMIMRAAEVLNDNTGVPERTHNDVGSHEAPHDVVGSWDEHYSPMGAAEAPHDKLGSPGAPNDVGLLETPCDNMEAPGMPHDDMGAGVPS